MLPFWKKKKVGKSNDAPSDKEQKRLLYGLPLEIQHLIVDFLGPEEWVVLRRVCNLFAQIVERDTFVIFRNYVGTKWHIIQTEIPSSYKVIDYVHRLERGQTEWVGFGTQQGFAPYPVRLKIDKIDKKGKLKGDCIWPTLGPSATRISGFTDGDQFDFCEHKMLYGEVVVPNQYRGTRFGNCALFVWAALGYTGQVFAVMRYVAELHPQFVDTYLPKNTRWTGLLAADSGMTVELTVSVEDVDKASRKLKVHAINGESINRHNPSLSQNTVVQQTRFIDVVLTEPNLIVTNTKTEGLDKQAISWLAWDSVYWLCYPDLIVGYVRYEFDHGSSIESVMFLKRCA